MLEKMLFSFKIIAFDDLFTTYNDIVFETNAIKPFCSKMVSNICVTRTSFGQRLGSSFASGVGLHGLFAHDFFAQGL